MKFSNSKIRSLLTTSVLAFSVTSVWSTNALAANAPAPTLAPAPAPTFVNLQILMEGAAQNVSGMMSTSLWDKGLIVPGQNLQSPCRDNSMHQITVTNPIPQTTPVDLVCVEIREQSFPMTVHTSFVGIVQANGMINFTDGSIPIIQLDHSDDYYVVVLHKSHLPIASELKSINNSMLYVNFRSEPTGSFGGVHQTNVGGGWAMFAGNTDQNGNQVRDINGGDSAYWSQIYPLSNTYSPADVNLDGDVDMTDKALITLNNGLFSNIPF